ncbi:dynein heavy chain 2, axonemal [Teleopsis dalmanni]|uniref:dynein heavy chain 2, axonemal n=1 Tax=Teleopsis dalmanni TaxID=139649 RepID=UPI0018CE77B4|nr:dynein heavy chain 2, axonemal [Teleopsis dalmanni]
MENFVYPDDYDTSELEEQAKAQPVVVNTEIEIPIPDYTDEELDTLVQYVKSLVMLRCYDVDSWSERAITNIRRWFMNINFLYLTTFYDSGFIEACCGFPLAPVGDICYFERKPLEIFRSSTFHTDVMRGSLQVDLDGCLLDTINHVYSLLVRNTVLWNENLKFIMVKDLDKFLSILNNFHHRLAGTTVLFVPHKSKVPMVASENDDDDERDDNKCMETLVLYWTTQIRALLSDKILIADNELLIPEDELNFWIYRCEILQGLYNQFFHTDVAGVIRILRQIHSVYVKQIDDLIQHCLREIAEAKLNIKFLSLMIKPCNRMEEARKLSEITQFIPDFINTVRFIWTNSKHYNRRDQITNIFRYFTNFIIKMCTKHLRIDYVLRGYSRTGIRLANLSCDIIFCYRWMYDIMSKYHARRMPRFGWGLEMAMIFNHIDAFVERLNDVLDICEAMIVFGRYGEKEEMPKVQFGGTHGMMFEKTVKSVEVQFRKTLLNLRNDCRDVILNVHRNEWYAEVLVYRKTVQTYEETIQRLMSAVFQRIRNIEEGVEVLHALFYFSYRPDLRKLYLRQVTELWVMVMAEMDHTVTALMGRVKHHLSWIPYYALRAQYNIINIERLEWLKNLIWNSDWLPIVPETNMAQDKFEDIQLTFDSNKIQYFEDWSNEIENDDLDAKLNYTLIRRSELSDEMIECNMDDAILYCCEQAVHFEKMGFQSPFTVKPVLDKYSTIRFVYNSVVKVCIDYNTIVSYLSDKERELFRALIQACDRKISPGVLKLTWGGELSDAYVADCALHTSRLEESLITYKRSNREIATVCRLICDYPFFQIKDPPISSLDEFEFLVEDDNDDNMDIVIGYYKDLLDLVYAVFAEFENYISEMPTEWFDYVYIIDAMLAVGLVTSARNSLVNMHLMLTPEGNLEPTPIIQSFLDIRFGEKILDPSMEDIFELFERIFEQICTNLNSFPRVGEKMGAPPECLNILFLDLYNEDQDALTVKIAILSELYNNSVAIENYMVYWDTYADLWEISESELTKIIESSEQTAEYYEEILLAYTAMAKEIAAAPKSTNVRVVLIELGPIKSSLLSLVEKWQVVMVKLLQKRAAARLKGIYRYIHRNGRRIRFQPRNLKEAKEATLFYNRLVEEIPQKESEFPHVRALFDAIDRCNTAIPELMRVLLINLDAEWLAYLKKIAEAEEMLEVTRDEFKKHLLAQADRFKTAIKEFLADFFLKVPTSIATHPKIALKYLNIIGNKIDACFEFENSLINDLTVFNINQSENLDLRKLQAELAIIKEIWELVNEWQKNWNEWKSGNFWEINIDIMEDTAITLYKSLNVLCKKYKDRNWEMLEVTTKTLDSFRRTLPLITALKNPCMRKRHWDQVRELMQTDFDETSKKFTLELIIELDFQSFSEEIQDISNAATMELQIENGIKNIAHIWKTQSFEMMFYRDGIYRIKNVDDCFQLLEEHMVQISAMKSTRFVEPFAEIVDYWERTLSYVAETLENTLNVQRQWLYLENIFSGEDIRKQLPEETERFNFITEEFRVITSRMFEVKTAVKATHLGGPPFLLKRLFSINDRLELIQRALEIYLESKRQIFPRFYFISNDDLLEILGNAKRPDLVQIHLKKLFDNLYKLELRKAGKTLNKWQATGMYSDDGEHVEFLSHVFLDGPSERWLAGVEDAMIAVMKERLKETRVSLRKLNTNREKWISLWPGQCILTTSQLTWTTECTRSLIHCQMVKQKKPLRKLKSKQNKVLNRLSEMSRKDLVKIMRLKVSTLITVEIHGRDVIERMYKNNCIDVTHFEWFSQLRFYWLRDKEICYIRQTNTEHKYAYEYTGNSGRLVITPLTDRCYITLTTALHLHRGGSPKGPAGTGKTETVKDLGKALGMWVIVTNCSEGLDYKSIGKNFSGLAQTGAWGCFDEFNRINIEVLSVVAQQILSIISALTAKLTEFVFEGTLIKLIHTVGLFITMNPGYAGRTELPDNLKSMFRPISMMVPDNMIIAENILFSDGFTNTRSLARKVYTLYELAKQQLSKQYHYDFGLRSMAALLRYAGRKRRQLPGTNEEEIVYLAMRDMNVARLTAADLPLFNGIMSDIFPGVVLPVIDYSYFKTAIENELRDHNLQIIPIAIKKILELYETKNSRHSTMIIGDTGTAKSITWKCLQGAFGRMNADKHAGWECVIVHPINPKALNLAELYGEYNLSTGEWLDGVLSSIMRVICADEELTQKWLLFDGPVDAVWIENMNSVMDDNKILTLVNSERITMPAQVSLLFEVADLAVASPATVSRCGMVYNDYNDWGWRPYVKSWLRNQKPPEYVELVETHFDDYLTKVLEMKRTKCKEIVKTNELNLVISMCKLLEGFATKQNGISAHNIDQLEQMTKYWFMFCLVWGICPVVDEEGRNRMDAYIRELESCFPIKDTVYDYYVDPHQKALLPWDAKLSETWRYNANQPFYKIIVPTIDTVRYDYVVSKLLQEENPVMLVGNVGTGKTSTAVSVMDSCDKTRYTVLSINISAQTTAAGLQESIENRTEKRTKTYFVPIGGKKMVCFMDDFNMPAKDTYGSQPPLELIRQWIDYKYWFNRKNQQKIYVQNTILMAAMGPPGGGRQVISPRTLSRFTIINMTFPTEATIVRIFGTMLKQKLEDFETEIREIGLKVTQATITLYNDVVVRMLPTPAKSHYLYNLRDISRVFQGLLRSHPEAHTKRSMFLRLWVHECFRVFSDRLVDDNDQGWFLNEMNDVLGKYMEITFHSLCPNKTIPIFGDFISNLGYYEDFVFETLRKFILNQLDEYNNFPGMTRMNIVFFKEAIEHVTRIVRVISQPRGHMLNIGIGGSGRQVLAKMAAFICEIGIFQIEVTKKYKSHEFKEDLKNLYKSTGVKQRPTIFIFSGEQVVENTFLEIINNMLSTGEANLFKADEFDELKAELERPAKKAGVMITTESLYNFFMQNVRENMHIAIAISPIGEEFRSYLRQYPALISTTTPDWFRLWPQEALLEVAQKFLADFSINVPVPGKENEVHRDSLVETTEDVLQRSVSYVFSVIHSSVADVSERMWLEVKRRNYVTSPTYLELVTGFQRLLEYKRGEISASANKLRNGLWKIADTQEKVTSMSEELKISSEQVKVLAKECEEFIAEIEVQKAQATERKEEVDAEAVIIRKEEVICMELAATAQADLEVVMPMVDAAIKALDALNKKDIAEVKSYGRPPMKIEKVMEAVLILLGKEPTWENAKKVLSDQNFLNDLRFFDRDNISDKTLKRIALYTKNPELEPDKVAIVSLACKSLMLWIIAIENYGKVYRIVAPKQEKLDNAMRSLAEKQAMLAAAKKRLQELMDQIAELYRLLNEKIEMLNELRIREEKLRKQLERAIILVESLSGEQQRWIDTVAQLDLAFERLPGDCLIATAFLSYLGPFDTKYRTILLEQWNKLILDNGIPATDELNITLFLSDAVTIREWNIQGLPADDFSTENGVIVNRGQRWPLIIDPQMQANTWIKNLEPELLVSDFGQFDYLKTLETALQVGAPVLLQNVGEQIDQAINPILRKSFTIQAGQKLIKFNDKYISYNNNFRLYLTTKIANPHYPPEIASKTTIVNFAVKQSGLQAQLLGIIVRKEKPILEEQKDDLVLTIAKHKRTLIDLDNEILRLLNESRGSILEDDELFSTLQKSRQTSVLVKESLTTAEFTEIEIDGARQEYQPAAERAAVLFFVLMDMSKIDPMYEFSLAAYILLFTQSIDRSPRHNIVYERILHINDYHTYSVYKNTCRGLFEVHKLLLSVHMAAKILDCAGRLVEAEYEFILKGGIVLDRQGQAPNPNQKWISEQSWDNVSELDKIAGFHGIVDSFEQNNYNWSVWYATTSPESEDLIGEWNEKLTDFQKICVVRCLRPDRISFCFTHFVVSVLGTRFVEPPVLDLKAVFEESMAQTPLIFVLSPGVDPTQSLMTLAEQLKMTSRMFSLSLGQGQAPVATKLIMDGVRDGNWVFLANCHLSLSWMPTLDKIIATMQSMKIHKRFRLWLSSSPNPEFPISILQTSIKMTTEPPRGIKANMKRLYNTLSDVNLEQCNDPSKYKKLIFSLCFFHSILLERKKFLQLGWNVVYSFNDSDFEVSEILLALYLNEYEETPFGALRFLIAGINYGGHITDDWDRRLLLTYINQFFNEEALTQLRYRLSTLQNYYIPGDGDHQFYLDQISQLPNFDKPEAFGQHPNADIASLIGEARMLFETLLSMQGQAATAVGENKETRVLHLAFDILINTPEELNYEQTSKIIGLNRTPLEVVLLQEIERYNVLLGNIKVHLRDLQKGIKGLVVMSTDLEEIFHAVYEGRVPLVWLKAYPSLKPLAAWSRDLSLRIEHFFFWSKTLRPPNLFWLSAYTFPTGFLTAVLQTSARATRTPIDELSWDFHVFIEEDAAAARIVREGGGVYVRSLFLEAAGWQRKMQCLQDPLPMELVCPMPVVHFKPVESLKKKTRGVYQCPTYYYPIRSGSYVIAVDLKSGVEKGEFWTKRATALLLSLST